MKKTGIASALLLALSSACAATAQSTPINIDALQFETVHEVAERTILARDAQGRPLVALLRLDRGDFLPPHGAKSDALRLLTVVSGELSWGDGNAVDESAERVFTAGTIVSIPPEGGEHWAAARNGDVLLQVVFVRGDTPD